MWSWIKCWWENQKQRSEQSSAGAEGERLAAAFLKQQHYRIVARNWRSPRDRRDEIDLICRDRDVLVFVEVKTRAADALVSGYHAVDKAKKRVMLRASRDYLQRLGSTHRPATFRFDVLEVTRARDGDAPVVRHFENVPLFPKEMV